MSRIFRLTYLTGQTALEKYAASAEGALFKDFYAKKLEGNGGILKIYKGDAPSADFFATSTGHWQNIVAYVLNDLPEILPASGFIGGAEPGEDDFHVGAWLTRVAWVCGATNDAEGYKALEKDKVTVAGGRGGPVGVGGFLLGGERYAELLDAFFSERE